MGRMRYKTIPCNCKMGQYALSDKKIPFPKTYPQLHAALLQTPSGARQVRPSLQTVVFPSHDMPRQPTQVPGVWEGDCDEVLVVEVVGFALDAALETGHEAPAAVYLVLTLPVSSHFTGWMTFFLSPFGLPWRFEKASTMMSMEPVPWGCEVCQHATRTIY